MPYKDPDSVAAKASRKRRNQKYRQRHPARVQRIKRSWRQHNREKENEYQRQYYASNRDRELGWHRAWVRENPSLDRIRKRRRRARKKGARGYSTAHQLQARWDFYGGLCWICGVDLLTLRKRDRTWDHVIPLARGGAEWPANLRPACRACNSRKNAN